MIRFEPLQTLKCSDLLRTYIALSLMCLSLFSLAQSVSVRGVVYDEKNETIPLVNIILKSDHSIGTISNVSGTFEISLPMGNHTLVFSHIQYEKQEITLSLEQGQTEYLSIILKMKSIVLNNVEIKGKKEQDAVAPVTKIDVKSAKNLPSAFGDFNKVLLTLPGVAGNNELSSAYNVRGGNFDENLVYVNDIPVYRPFLSNAGRQEGLSFINPDLVGDIDFYAGGWATKYGDKLSSSLNIDYKEPVAREGNINMGLLGGSAYIGNSISNVQYLLGVRHRDSRYLLNTLETTGHYMPSYTDVQAFFTFDHSKKFERINQAKLYWLLAYGRNRYLTLPESQVTEFGSVSENLRIQTAFEGVEKLNYDTYQSGINFSYRWSNTFLSRWIVSGIHTTEREYYNVEGAYRICDIDNDPGSNNFNECIVERGIGTYFNYGRNKLQATLFNTEWRNEWLLSDWSILEGGIGVTRNKIEDGINEYNFVDSAGFVNILESTFNKLNLSTTTLTGYLQNTIFFFDSVSTINAGLRFNYFSYNGEIIYSPRFIYRYKPKWKREISFRFSVGLYAQPPFYRELRDRQGEIQNDVKAQKSIHYILAMERGFNWWNRPFLFTVESYYKTYKNVIPYDIDNVRLRYFADNNAKAFAYGLDLRVNGEFIKGIQSWFSLGLLKTKEDIMEDDKGYIRRPSDQNINLAFYFEDYIPNDPTIRVYVNSVFGSGYPVGPPNEINARNIFSGDEYYRVDMGVSKSFEFINHKYLKNIGIRAEVLNVFGADNTLSYSWIQDVNGGQLAIPNSLSARFLNLRVLADF